MTFTLPVMVMAPAIAPALSGEGLTEAEVDGVGSCAGLVGPGVGVEGVAVCG